MTTPPQGGPAPAQFAPLPPGVASGINGGIPFSGDPTLSYIEIRDFSPGIFHNPSLPVQQAVDGAAQLDGTVDCCAALTGELMPGPRRIFKYNETSLPSTPSSSPEYYPQGMARVKIEEMRVVSPVFFHYLDHESTLPDIVFLGRSHWYNALGAGPGGAYTQRLDVRRLEFHLALSPGARASLKNPMVDSLDIPLSATVGTVASLTAGALTITAGSSVVNGQVSFDIGRSNTTTATSVGYPVVVGTLFPRYSVTSSSQFHHPPNGAPTTNTVGSVDFGQTGANAPYLIIAHQDRFLGIGYGAVAGTANFGANTNIRAEAVMATAVNDADTSAGISSIFSNESPYGVGTWCSMNASELLIVKQRGGGYVLRGDLENAQILRLPGIASANPMHRGVMTTQGFVYGNRRGVWIWPGGDASICISDQIEGFFWNAVEDVEPPNLDSVPTREGPAEERRVFYGNFGFSYPYCFVPNNFFYDTRLGSWWRLSRPGKYAYMHYADSANGNIIACPSDFDNEDLNVINWYALDKGANSYQWKSQPLHRTQYHILNYREIVLFAQGEAAEVIFTLEGIDGVTTTTKFEFDSPNRRICLRAPINIETHDVVVTIAARSKDLTKAAPSLTFALGYREGNTVEQIDDDGLYS